MAHKVNLVIDQGTTFSTSFTIVDTNGDAIDFSTYTANSQMRKTYTSNTAYTFTVAANSSGVIVLSMNSATTSTITAGRYLYDVEVQDASSNRSRIVEGIVTVTPEVTR
jgi:hypothetical protein